MSLLSAITWPSTVAFMLRLRVRSPKRGGLGWRFQAVTVCETHGGAGSRLQVAAESRRCQAVLDAYCARDASCGIVPSLLGPEHGLRLRVGSARDNGEPLCRCCFGFHGSSGPECWWCPPDRSVAASDQRQAAR